MIQWEKCERLDPKNIFDLFNFSSEILYLRVNKNIFVKGFEFFINSTHRQVSAVFECQLKRRKDVLQSTKISLTKVKEAKIFAALFSTPVLVEANKSYSLSVKRLSHEELEVYSSFRGHKSKDVGSVTFQFRRNSQSHFVISEGLISAIIFYKAEKKA